jgi:hypothetical protein
MVKKEMGGFKVKPYRKDVDTITSQATGDKPKVMSRQDFSDDKMGPNMGRDAKKKEDKPKPKAKPAVKKLKDTSGDYYTANGISGDMGSASGEMGPDMGKVNKGGYDPEEGMKRGGKVKPKCMARGGGIEVRGKTRGRMV